MDAVSASISMSFADKEVLASRWLVRWSGFIQLFAFIVEGLALGTLPSSKITDDHDRKCNVVLPWVGSLSSQYGAPPELWLYLAFRLALWLAQFLLGITLMGKFNDLEHNKYEESRRLYGPRWERVPATVTTSYLLFCGAIVIHTRSLSDLRKELHLNESQGTVLISEWGQSAPVIICIAALSHVGYVQWRLFQPKAWRDRQIIRTACEEPSEKQIGEEVPRNWYLRHPMALFAFLQSVDHCLILPIEKGLESTIVDPDTLSAEKQQELWERLLVSIEKNDPIGLRICLREGAPLLHEDGMKESLLHRAARHGNQDLLVELCNREEQRNLFKDLASPNARKETPLFYAVRSQNGVAVRFFLKQYNLYGREINPYGEFLSGDRESTFKDAILSNHRETVEPYLNNDIWPQWQDVYIADRDRGGMDVQLSALAFAYNQEKRSVAELLIEQGGSMRPIDTCIIYQEDIVHLADLVDNTKVLERWIFKDVSQGLSREALPSVLHPWIECVARLYPSLKFGDKILNAVLRHVHETAMVLYYHVKEIGDLDVIEHLVQVIGFTRNYDDLYLVAIEADDNQSNGTQRSDVYLPTDSPRAQILHRMREAGRAVLLSGQWNNPGSRNPGSSTPVSAEDLFSALFSEVPSSSVKAVWALKHDGETALHLAARRGDVKIMKNLLEAGANPCAQCGHGSTLMECIGEPHEEEFSFTLKDIKHYRVNVGEYMTKETLRNREALLTLKDVKFRRPRTQEQGRADYTAVEKLLEDAQNKEAHEFSFETYYEECERSMNVQPPEENLLGHLQSFLLLIPKSQPPFIKTHTAARKHNIANRWTRKYLRKFPTARTS